MECSVQGCIRHVFARGLCHTHYDADRKANAPRCTTAGCDKPQHAGGFCGPHYRAAKASSAPSCEVQGCGRAAVAGGLCDSHRKRKARHGHLDTQRPQDWGAKVAHPLYDSWAWRRRGSASNGVAPEWRDFWLFVRDVGERPSPRHYLRRKLADMPLGPENFEWREPLAITEATTRKEYKAAYQREYRAAHPQRHRSHGFQRRYGIDYAQYQEMSDKQGGVCAICKRPERFLNQHTHEPRLMAVDHCHTSNKVRGLLCHRCNTAIGSFDEDPARMKAAIKYLAKHRE